MISTLQFATELACSTGKLLTEFYRPGGSEARLKADQSVVTEADLAADRLVKQAIRDAYPQDLLLSEELHPSLSVGNQEAVWVVDPLDGTTNFSLGLHIWGVSIARAVNGIPETGAIYFPLLDELYSAQIGTGAFWNGERIRVQPMDKEKPATFFACCGQTHKLYNVSVPYKPRILGSAAYDFCALARGAAVLTFEATPKIWDLAAVWVLILEAGGVIESHHGPSPFPLTPGMNYTKRAFPTLAAATAKMVVKGRNMIKIKDELLLTNDG